MKRDYFSLVVFGHPNRAPLRPTPHCRGNQKTSSKTAVARKRIARLLKANLTLQPALRPEGKGQLWGP